MKNGLKKVMALVAVATTLTGGVTVLADEVPSGSATTETTETATTTPEEIKDAAVKYSTHVQNIGWQEYVSNGESAGTEGKSLRLEGIKIKVDSEADLGIEYSTHVQNKGWQDYVSDGDKSGTEGQRLRLEAIKIRLTGEDKDNYDVYYRVHVSHFGWLDWAKDNEVAGTVGCAKRLESIQIKIVKKGEEAPDFTEENKGVSCVTKPNIFYTTHVQKKGWVSSSHDGITNGTTGKGLRLEGIKIETNDQNLNVEYSTHVQNVGWQDYVSNGAKAGTEGKALRLEAIKIKLSGNDAKYFDVYYRVHSQHFGWLGWTKNGNPAGTEGYRYRLEAIQVAIVPKGNKAPGSISGAFKKAPKKAPSTSKGFTDGYIDEAYTKELYNAVCYNNGLYGINHGVGGAQLSNICRAVAEGKMDKKTAEAQANSIKGIETSIFGSEPFQFYDAQCKIFTMKKMSGSDFYKTLGGPVPGYGFVFAYRHANGTYTVATLGAQG